MFGQKRNRRNCSIGVERLDERVSLSGFNVAPTNPLSGPVMRSGPTLFLVNSISPTATHPVAPTNPLSGPVVRSGNTFFAVAGVTPSFSGAPTFSLTNPLRGAVIHSGSTLFAIW